ncbi:MAG: hypothetical protein QM725_05805 [Lacibacter sp.]
MISTLFKYRHIFSTGIFISLFILTLPLYQYRFDVDGIGAMTVALSIMKHDWLRGVNGVWSPLNSWIASLFPGLANNPVLPFKLINAACSIFIIILFQGLSNQIINAKEKSHKLILIAVAFILPVILLSYTHFQLAGDLLQLSIVLLYLYYIFTQNVFKSVTKSIIAGMMIALACYSKAFSLPLLFLSHLVIGFLTFKNYEENRYQPYIKSVLITYTTLFILLAPWIFLMHQKYGVWSFSTVQTFNFNWLLNDQSYTTLKSAELLMKPPYPDSPTAWEDPFIYYNYTLSGPFDTWANFLRFLKNILHNIKVSISSLNVLSFLSIPVLVYYSVKLLTQKENILQVKILLFISIFVVSGYTLIYVEPRYIWLTGIITLLIGSKFIIEQLADKLNPKSLLFVTAVFVSSYLLAPADYLQDLRYSGKDIYQTASFLQANKLTKNFTAVVSNASEGSFCDQLAFVLKGRFFKITQPVYNDNRLIQSCKDNNIQFIIYFYHSGKEKELLQFSILEKQSAKKIALPDKNAVVFIL